MLPETRFSVDLKINKQVSDQKKQLRYKPLPLWLEIACFASLYGVGSVLVLRSNYLPILTIGLLWMVVYILCGLTVVVYINRRQLCSPKEVWIRFMIGVIGILLAGWLYSQA